MKAELHETEPVPTYETGVKLTKDAMRQVETQLQRLPALGKWFVDIVPPVWHSGMINFFRVPYPYFSFLLALQRHLHEHAL